MPNEHTETVQLPLSVKAWNTENFVDVFKQEFSSLDPHSLPLQKALQNSSYVSGEAFSPMLLQSSSHAHSIDLKVGIFYTGIIAGCSCADDPSPMDTQNEYCEVLLTIDRQTGLGQIRLNLDNENA